MPLTTSEVKQRLGRGALTDIAQHYGLTKGHVSQVLNGLRSDRRIARFVAKRLKVRIADLPEHYVAIRSTIAA